MPPDLLSKLLSGELADPDGSGPLSVDTRRVVIDSSLAGREADLIGQVGLQGPVLLVADAATWSALGSRVFEALRTRGILIRKQVFPKDVHPTMASVAVVEAAARGCAGLIAVGSGTVNDLAKCAAFRLQRPYVVFGTAASMNGYTSVNASITVEGHKKTLGAAAPIAAFFDLEVLTLAPARLTQAGVGDSLCRATAQTDWLLSHRLLGTPYRGAPFWLLHQEEEALITQLPALAAGSDAAMRHLVRTLVLSGFGMTICGGSYPASQGEHLISHYLEMYEDPRWPKSYHGEHIAVSTLTMARLQSALLAKPELSLQPLVPIEAQFRRRFGDERGTAFSTEFKRKMSLVETAGAAQRLTDHWPDIQAELSRVYRPAATIEVALKAIGAPTRPSDIGVPESSYREAVQNARYIRDRYTFLDFAGDTGHSSLYEEV